MRSRCEVCNGPLGDTTFKECEACQRLQRACRRACGLFVDADYGLHEIAHHIILFRRPPHRRRDWRAIEKVIDSMPVGIAQIHEMRTLALQYVAQNEMGWRTSLRGLVWPSWFGLEDALCDSRSEGGARGGYAVVRSVHAALRYTRCLIPCVSRRNVRLFQGIVQRMRS